MFNNLFLLICLQGEASRQEIWTIVNNKSVYLRIMNTKNLFTLRLVPNMNLN